MTTVASTTPRSSRRIWTATLVALAILGIALAAWLLWSASRAPLPAASSGVEPRAGAWQTFVIASAKAHPVPAAPDKAATQAEIEQLKALVSQRDTQALDQIAYWDTGAPSYRWNEIILRQAVKRNLSSPASARPLALLHVAIYDAMVAAWDAKYTHNRPRPSEVDTRLTTAIANPRSPSYPSEYAVTAGAAQAVLSYLFPDDAAFFAQQAEAATRSRLLAGVEYPSDVAAGLELGKAVAAEVIERAKTDGAAAQWTGSIPTGPGLWTGTNPGLPQMATWKTWVLSAPNEFRPGPPPAYDSPEEAKEMDEVRAFQRTPKSNADALFWEYGAGGQRGFQWWFEQAARETLEYRLDANPPRAARALAVLSVAYYDAFVGCWDAKYTYWAMRPFQLDPNFKPLFTTPNHPSYPSAHSCASTAAAATLGYLFPRDAQALNALAREAGESRIWGGIHFRSDVVAGEALGRAVAQKVIDRAKRDGE